MKRTLLLGLLLLPGILYAAVCKTVGEDGVVKFQNLPGTECPAGWTLTDYGNPITSSPRVRAFQAGVSGRQVPFAGYRSIEIVSPADGGVVRTNERRVTLSVTLEPQLQPYHFVTAYLDGRTFRGAYGSSQTALTDIDRGTHQLRVTVFDAKGQALIESKTISFTLLQALPLQVQQVAPREDTGNYVIQGQFLGGPSGVGSTVEIQFPDSGTTYTGEVRPDLVWEVDVGKEPQTEDKFDVDVTTPANLQFRKTQVISPVIKRPAYNPPPFRGYVPPAGGDYAPPPGSPPPPAGTNPAFAPNFSTGR